MKNFFRECLITLIVWLEIGAEAQAEMEREGLILLTPIIHF